MVERNSVSTYIENPTYGFGHNTDVHFTRFFFYVLNS